MDVGFIILLVTLALWAAGFLLLPRLRRCDEGEAADQPLAVSVIIPARNEEHNLPALLRSLAVQPAKPREIIVVDDGSMDRTAEIARQHGATVIASQPLPEGWRGKTWACHQGAQAASGEMLSFRMYPNGLRELIEGWTKGFASGAGQTPRGTLWRVVGWMIGVMLSPLGWLMTQDGLGLGAALQKAC